MRLAAENTVIAQGTFSLPEKASASSKTVLAGVGYSRNTYAQNREAICAWLRGDHSKNALVGYLNPHVFNIAKKNAQVREFLAKADVVGVDGLGVAVAAWLLNGEPQQRSVMTPLFDEVWTMEDLPPLRAVLIGGTDEVVKLGAAALNKAGRKLEVIATCNGYQSIDQYLELIQTHAKSSIVLVAMGTPRSEELIVAADHAFSGKLLWNIGGGTLHFHAGTQPCVPKMVSALGVQWLWRIIHEPRITPRYVIGIPLFVWYLLRSLFTRKTIGEKL